jgi:hypothetical protein
MSTITERVAAGAAFLDEHDPEWWRPDVDGAISLDTLDLMNGNLCVLGQRCPLETSDCPFYVQAGRVSGIAADYAGRDWDHQEVAELLIDEWAKPLGFQAFGLLAEERADDFAALTVKWKRVITERRSAS